MSPPPVCPIVLTAHARDALGARFGDISEVLALGLLDLFLDEAEPVGRGAHPTTRVMRHPAMTIITEFTRQETRVVTLLPAGWPIAAFGQLQRLASGELPATGSSVLALQAYFGRSR